MNSFQKSLESFVIKISLDKKKEIGTGFYISENLIATCYHVLDVDSEVLKDEYWIYHDEWEDWEPAKPIKEYCRNRPHDIALMATSKKIEKNIIYQIAPWDKEESQFRSIGYDSIKKEYGIGANTIEGSITGRTIYRKSPRLTLKSLENTILRGRSGSPVWSVNQMAVVGIIASVNSKITPKSTELGLAIPIEEVLHSNILKPFGVSKLTGPLSLFASKNKQIEIDILKYKQVLKIKFGLIKHNSFAVNVEPKKIHLSDMFIWQNVRKGIRPFEIPKEHQQKVDIERKLNKERKRKLPSSDEIDRLKKELQRYVKLEEEWVSWSKENVFLLEKIFNNSKYNSLVILGDPGSGKSTLTHFLCVNWMEIDSKEITFLIELRKYVQDPVNPKNFVDYLMNGKNNFFQFEDESFIKYLTDSNSTVIFDGLDEIIDLRVRESVVTEIIRFRIDYPKIRIVVTSRIIGYDPQDFLGADFEHFTLQDFDKKQISHYIKKWYKLFSCNTKKRERLVNRLFEAIRNSTAISLLSGNPLLLTMIVILNSQKELPRERSELYKQCSDILLDNWDFKKHLPEDNKSNLSKIGISEKQEMLRKLAYYMLTVSKKYSGNYIERYELEKVLTDYFVSEREIEKSISISASIIIINQLRERNFILCHPGGDHYAFVHSTFLEFFCAWELVWQFEKTQKYSVDDIQNTFNKYWRNHSWHEILKLIIGMIDEEYAGKIINYLINLEQVEFENIFQACEFIIEVKNREKIISVDRNLKTKMYNLVNYSITDYYEPYGNGKFIVEDSSSQIFRSNVVAIIAKTWRHVPETKEWLISMMSPYNKPDLIKSAINALINGWKTDLDVCNIVIKKQLLSLLNEIDESGFLQERYKKDIKIVVEKAIVEIDKSKFSFNNVKEVLKQAESIVHDIRQSHTLLDESIQYIIGTINKILMKEPI